MIFDFRKKPKQLQRRLMKKILLTIIIVYCFNGIAVNAQPVVTTIPGTGNLAYGISPSGNYVTGTIGSSGGFLYRLSGNVYQTIGGEEAYDVTDLGKVVGTYLDTNYQFNGVPFPIAGFYEAGNWSTPGLIPGVVPFSSTQYSYGYGISDDGSSMCGMVWRNAGTTRAFTWNTTSGYFLLKDLNQSAKAMCISGDGSVAGGWVQGNQRLPYFWNPDSNLLDPNGGEVHAINFNGYLMVGTASGNAFYRDSLNGLQYLPAVSGANGADAYGVSDSGVVVGEYTTGNFPPFTRNAFIYFPGIGMLDLRDYLISQNATNVPSSLQTASGISRDGRTIIALNTFPFTSFVITLDSLPTAIPKNLKLKESFIVYPNPATSGKIFISGQSISNNPTLKITDALGKEVRSIDIQLAKSSEFNLTIDLKSQENNYLPAGIYFLSLISEGNKITRKLIVD